MISYRTLKAEDFQQLHQTLLEAFSDYAVQMQPGQESLRRLYLIEGVNFDLSIGAFDGERMVGFTVNGTGDWQGIPTVYDAGTGVIPEYRRRGISRGMFDFILPVLRAHHFEQYLLEVITENTPAVNLYKNLGFTIQRDLSVFNRKEPISTDSVRSDAEIIQIEKPDWDLFESFREYYPSWQNSADSLKRSETDETIEKAYLMVKFKGEIIGYGIVFKKSGNAPQIAISKPFRRQGFGTALLNSLQKHTDKPLLFSNVDEKAREVSGFLNSNEFSLLTRQYEMMLKL